MVVMNSIPLLVSSGIEAGSWVTANAEWLKIVVEKHEAIITELQVEKYQKAYDGFLESIDIRDKSRGDDVNNKLQVNYAQTIIDTPVDYMTGKPITWTVYDPKAPPVEEAAEGAEVGLTIIDEYREDLLAIVKTEEAKQALSELLRQGSIAGYSGIITYVDEEGVIGFDEYPVQELIPVYNTKGKLKLVLRKFLVEEGDESYTRLEYYDNKYVAFYKGDDKGEAFVLDAEEALTGNPIEHKAARIPVSIFTNGTPSSYEKRQKRAGVSDFDNGVMTILENYAGVMSDKANTVENLLDQFLLLEGVTVDEKEVLKMRKARSIALKSKESKASFMVQNQEDKAIENHLQRLKDTIHDMSFTPNLHDNAVMTATEIKMKYTALDIKAGRKDIYFMAAVRHFVQTVTDMLNARRLITAGVTDTYAVLEAFNKPVKVEGEEVPTPIELYNAEWVDITINRNIPQNFTEIAGIVSSLAGRVPDAYLYELLWFIEDPVAALEDMKAQKAADAEAAATAARSAMGFGGEFGTT